METNARFKAVFRLKPIEWKTTVAPTSASGDGCVALPTETYRNKVGDVLELGAIPAQGYHFVNWTRNGEEVATSVVAKITLTALTDSEDTAIYTANFEQNS